jgi:hypothetical protein
MKAAAVPVGMSWMLTLAFDYHGDRTPTHGYEATREGGDGSVRQVMAAAWDLEMLGLVSGFWQWLEDASQGQTAFIGSLIGSSIGLIPHSPDNALSFGAACAIQI